MQANAIAHHTKTPSTAATTYESQFEHVRTFCQTINHTNHKAVQEKTRQKALQTEFEQANGRGQNRRGEGHGHGRGHGNRWGVNPGHGRQPEGRGGRTGGQYHNWIPHVQFDQLDNESYARLIRDHVAHGKLAANNTETTPATVMSTTVSPLTQVQVPNQANTETPSVITGIPSSPALSTHPHSTSMAIITPSPPIRGATTAASMDSGPNTMLHQLMSNASARSANSTGTHHQSRRDNHLSYRIPAHRISNGVYRGHR